MMYFRCDGCSAPIASEPTRVAVQWPRERDYRPDRHLCGPCSAALLALLARAPAGGEPSGLTPSKS